MYEAERITMVGMCFRWYSKILTGKEFPMNVLALRFIVLELLRGFVDDATSFDEL